MIGIYLIQVGMMVGFLPLTIMITMKMLKVIQTRKLY